MRTFTRIWLIASTLTLILSACAPASPTLIVPAPPHQPTPPAAQTPISEPPDAAMPVIEYKDGRNQLIVISSVTGEVFEAFAPIPLGQSYYAYAFASGTPALAVVAAGQLYLIDLPSWQYHTFDVDLHGWLNSVSVVYSPDESLLVLARGDSDGGLRIVDAKSGEIKASAQAGFAIRNVKFTTDGKAIMVYGPQLAKTGVAANAGVSIGAPKAALLGAADLSVIWSVELTGIKHGTFPKNADAPITEDIYQPGTAWYYEPGAAFDPNRDKLYLAHGDEDKLTAVDFTDRTFTTVAVRERTSWFDQLLSLTADIAYAKGMSGASKWAFISPDGKFLFVVGSTIETTQSAFKMTSTGLEVISTEDGTLVDHINAEGNSLQFFSSDGERLFLTGWTNQVSYQTPWTVIYDMSSHTLIQRIDKVSLTPTLLLNGKPIWVSSYGVSDNLCYMASVDSTTWTIVNEWRGKQCFGWLIEP